MLNCCLDFKSRGFNKLRCDMYVSHPKWSYCRPVTKIDNRIYVYSCIKHEKYKICFIRHIHLKCRLQVSQISSWAPPCWAGRGLGTWSSWRRSSATPGPIRGEHGATWPALHQSQLTWSWAKVGGSCSLLGAILGGAGGCCPGNRLPL